MDYTNKLGAATLSQGPTPTGRDKLFDALYNALGGTPDRRWAADKMTTALDWGTLGMLTGAYDGGRELAETGRPAALAMALMPGAAAAKVSAPAARNVLLQAFHGTDKAFKHLDPSMVRADAPFPMMWVTPSEHRAKFYGDVVMPIDVGQGRYADAATQQGQEDIRKALGSEKQTVPHWEYFRDNPAALQELRSMGYDGVWMQELPGHNSLAVWSEDKLTHTPGAFRRWSGVPLMKGGTQ